MAFRSPSLSILVVCDTVGATQQISFAQPLADSISSGEVSLAMVGHDPALGGSLGVSYLVGNLSAGCADTFALYLQGWRKA